MGEYRCECRAPGGPGEDADCVSRLEAASLAGALEQALEACRGEGVVEYCACRPPDGPVRARVVVHYPPRLLEQALRVASVFEAPGIEVGLLPERISEVVIEGPSFATTDLTWATAMLRRYLLALERRAVEHA